ncbi:MAG TPA: hypothetical protein VF846_20560 [Thermoanaerobaculia bacterium]
MRISALILVLCAATLPLLGQTSPTASDLTEAQTNLTQQNETPEEKYKKKYENWRDTRRNQTDQRSAFIGSVYLGEVIDTFAADEVLKYLNPEDANERKFRTVGGVDFQYRLTGSAASGRQLWVFGETVHGVRSRDVDCKKENNMKLTVCQENIDVGQVPTGPNDFIAILRNAGTLEAFVGFRYEFPPPLQDLTDSPARLFVKGQLGFLSVAGGGGDVVDEHSMSIGATAVAGRFQGSFLQVGYGRNDLFLRNPNKRLVVDALLSIDPQYIPGLRNNDRLRPFLEFTGNFDGGDGADSIQTWFGFDYEFRDPWDYRGYPKEQ